MTFDWTGYVAQLNDFPSLNSQWEKDMVVEIKERIPELRRVLEVGCSNGRWLRWFCKEYNCEAHGVDNNLTGFKSNSVISFMAADAFHLPYGDNLFDAVISLGFIEHFKKHERFRLLKEQVRVLRNNGFLICEIPNLAVSLEYFWVKVFYDWKQGFKHFIVTEKEVMQCYEDLDLHVISGRFLGWFFERFHGRFLGPFFQRVHSISALFSQITANDYLLIGAKKT